MGRPHDGQVRDFAPGPNLSPAASTLVANDNHGGQPLYSSGLPPDARAIIEPVPVGVNQSGRTKAGIWRLRFADRWRPCADPLTGWTGGGDPLTQIELRFADLEAAERYCRREDVSFEIRGTTDASRTVAHRLNGETPPRFCCWPTARMRDVAATTLFDASRDERPPAAAHFAFSLAG